MARAQVPPRQQVNEGAEGFQHVIGQIKRIGHAGVVNAEGRQEAHAHQRAGHTGPQHRIAVIQQRIPQIRFIFPSEIGP